MYSRLYGNVLIKIMLVLVINQIVEKYIYSHITWFILVHDWLNISQMSWLIQMYYFVPLKKLLCSDYEYVKKSSVSLLKFYYIHVDRCLILFCFVALKSACIFSILLFSFGIWFNFLFVCLFFFHHCTIILHRILSMHS